MGKNVSRGDRLFDVTIHYDSNVDRVSVVAPDDLVARSRALASAERDYHKAGGEMPRVEFCEIVLVRDCVCA